MEYTVNNKKFNYIFEKIENMKNNALKKIEDNSKKELQEQIEKQDSYTYHYAKIKTPAEEYQKKLNELNEYYKGELKKKENSILEYREELKKKLISQIKSTDNIVDIAVKIEDILISYENHFNIETK
jgi:mevalonate kinase